MKRAWIRRGTVIPGALLVCVSLMAADLTGTWTGQLPPRQNAQGQPQATLGPDIVFQFTQSGTSLAGKQYGDYTSSPLTGGEIAGDQIQFKIVVSEQAGNQTNTARYAYTGIVTGDEIKLTRVRESSVNVGNGEIAPAKNAAPQSFVLKRLL